MSEKRQKLSLVVPVYNEAAGLDDFHQSLTPVAKSLAVDYEIIYCDDGSQDATPQVLKQLCKQDKHVKLLRLSRNFGKENALTAGLVAAAGDAILMLDGDGQHPVELIPRFVEAWQAGAQVVVGVRVASASDGQLRRWGSRLFNSLMNRVTRQNVPVGSTDFRLIDREVQQAFLQLKENDRLTRGLIDWLGFERHYLNFEAKPRLKGRPTYDWRKLARLMIDSFVPLTPMPLYILGIFGAIVAACSLIYLLIGASEKYLLFDAFDWRISGQAMLQAIILLISGTILMAQGVLSLYASYTLRQAKARPNYIIDKSRSHGL